ncbi:MAG: aminoglycoside phosphotransferase family protein [Thiolinea sp.]
MNTAIRMNTMTETLRHATHPETVRTTLNREWDYLRNRNLRIETCSVHRAFPYKAGQYVVKYEFLLDDGKQTHIQPAFGELVSENVEAYRREIVTKLRKTRRGQIGRDQDTDLVAAIPSLSMLLRLPGMDEKLPGLILAHNHEHAQRHLSSLLGDAKDGVSSILSTTILNHRLGKRCILRAEQDSSNSSANSVILRCLRQHDIKHRYNYEVMQALWEHGFNDTAKDAIRIPEPLQIIDALSTLIMEDVPGEMLGETTRWSLYRQAGLAGAALGKLHHCPLQVGKTYSIQEELQMLAGWVRLTSQLRPDLRDALQDAFTYVRGQLLKLPGITPVLAHRDFYGKQILYDGEQTILIDFDTLCHTDPALDIGNYLAHNIFSGLQAGKHFNPVEHRLFLEAYGETCHLPPMHRIDIWTQATLLRLACLYALSTDCQHLIPGILGEIPAGLA